MKREVVIHNIGVKNGSITLLTASPTLAEPKAQSWHGWRRGSRDNTTMVCISIYGVMVCLALALGTWLFTSTRILINASPSLPYRWFFCHQGASYNRGDVVAVKGHRTAYTGDVFLTKRVVGLPGDTLVLTQGEMVVAGKSVGKLHTHTKDGRRLTPLAAKIVPQGYVFLHATHPRSFDSRYEEFGVVHKTHIQGRCVGFLPRSLA